MLSCESIKRCLCESWGLLESLCLTLSLNQSTYLQHPRPFPCLSCIPGPASPTDYVRAVVSRALAVEQWWAQSQAGTLLTSGECSHTPATDPPSPAHLGGMAYQLP